MRGTTNISAFESFRQGVHVRKTPITVATWAESESHFRQAIELDTGTDLETAFSLKVGLPRAWSWLAYGRALTWLEGWQDDDMRQSAVSFADLGVQLDPFDYDTHWVAAFVHLAAGDAEKADFHRVRALDLVEEDHNPLLFNEMADILVWLGQPDAAYEMLDRTRRITDWNRWSMAWSLYFRGQADPSLYDQALAEAEGTFWKPGDEKYEDDIQLLIAAIAIQQAKICDDNNDTANGNLKRQRAEEALTLFNASTPGWTIAQEMHRMPFGPSPDAVAARAHWVDALTRLEIPET